MENKKKNEDLNTKKKIKYDKPELISIGERSKTFGGFAGCNPTGSAAGTCVGGVAPN